MKNNLVGKYVQFTKAAEEYEFGFDPGMIARVDAVKEKSAETILQVTFNFSNPKIEKYNQSKMVANWTHPITKAYSLKWNETELSPKNHVSSDYVDIDNPPFKVISPLRVWFVTRLFSFF
mgnify:FL=1